MFLNSKKRKNGFTLIELLTVVGIISLLASVIMSSLGSAKERARDTRRISDMKQIQVALELYYTDNGSYPTTSDNDCSGWDGGKVGVGDRFITLLESGNHMENVPGDPLSTIAPSCTSFYGYQRFTAGSYGCDVKKGAFYVLGVYDMETSGNPHPDSPGFVCGVTDFGATYDWVAGKFESDQ